MPKTENVHRDDQRTKRGQVQAMHKQGSKQFINPYIRYRGDWSDRK